MARLPLNSVLYEWFHIYTSREHLENFEKITYTRDGWYRVPEGWLLVRHLDSGSIEASFWELNMREMFSDIGKLPEIHGMSDLRKNHNKP